ncbi:bacteriocin-protection, YdeI or OmpD-associated domain-containing protein [Trichoderma sp. SZMC 28012]
MSTRRITRAAVAKAAVEASSSPATSTTSSSKPLITKSKAKSKIAKSSAESSTVPIKSRPKPSLTSSSSSSSSSTTQTLSFPSASHFDAWLLNAGTSTPSGIWLRFSKKSIIAKVPSISYLDAVDTSLCHGWIDGQRKRLDEHFFLQRFTPRRPRSLWSARNVERVEMLTAEGRMKPAGIAAVDAAKGDGRWDKAYAGPATMEVPEDFEDALAENEAAKVMFQGLGKSQRYSFLWRIHTAKKTETRERRIREFVNLLAEGKTL